MATTNISYQDFKPDWWDAVGISAEAVKAQIGSITESAFGPVGISAIQMQSMVDSIFANYQGQQALKAAANAAQEATRYADLPNSPLYLNAIATQASSENIAAQWFAQSTQIMKNTELNSIMVGNATRLASALGPTINTIQLGVAVVSGDAYVVGQTATSVLAGMAIGSWFMAGTASILSGLVAAELIVTAPAWIPIAVGIGFGFAASKTWDWFWRNGAADYYGIKRGDEFSLRRLKDSIHDLFSSATKVLPPRRDPLTFDLNGNGLETTAIAATNPILFDHNGDGIKTATGWVAPSDGFLVLDRNGNGTIDNGRKLFGDSTIKSNGQTAKDGFDALADLDSNVDGKIDANDTQFSNLRIWRDLNQDGISQTAELFTLASLNIASINVAKSSNSQMLANGNQIADIGSYTKTDGSQAAVGEVTGSLADVNLASDTFHRSFTDVLDTTSVATLPDMQACTGMFLSSGSGKVRDLREAAKQTAANDKDWRIAA